MILPDAVWYCLILPDTTWHYSLLQYNVWYCVILPDAAWCCLILPDATRYCLMLLEIVWYYLILPVTAWYCLLLPVTAWYDTSSMILALKYSLYDTCKKLYTDKMNILTKEMLPHTYFILTEFILLLNFPQIPSSNSQVFYQDPILHYEEIHNQHSAGGCVKLFLVISFRTHIKYFSIKMFLLFFALWLTRNKW